MTIYIQIGTNNGNDNFRKLVIKDKPDTVILIEPNPNLINEIKNNYKDIPNVTILNNALYYTDTECSLYIPKCNIYGIASNGCKYTDLHFSLCPMNDWGHEKEDMVEIKTQGITFDTLLKNYNITNIDYLQIDTEGFDSEIIQMIPFEKYNIDVIRYENWEFNTDAFTKHNKDISDKLGKNGMKIVEDILIKNNYKLSQIKDHDNNDIIATKIKN